MDTEKDTVVYSTEAYYAIAGSLVPMGRFTPELLTAKTEADIEMVCDKFGLEHKPYSPCADPVRFVYGVSRNCKFNTSDDFVPSYESWLLERAKTISTCLQLYAVCLPVVRKTTNNSETTDMFNVLYYAQKAHQQIVSEIYQNYDWIPHQETRKSRMDHYLRQVPRFPLIALFEAFQTTEGYHLQELYGYTFKQVRRRGNLSPPQSHYHYWENPAACTDARNRLWGYTSKHRTYNDDYILRWDVLGLASKCLYILDRHIERKLDTVNLRLNSASGTAGLVANDVGSALSLWLFTQIQAQADYRVCKMCGRLFIIGAQKGKKYCDLHKKHEINYYNKTIGRLEKNCPADETDLSLGNAVDDT